MLLVDHDEDFRQKLAATLKQSGFTVYIASRGLDGIDQARRYAPDLIVTRLELSDLSGRELTLTLRVDREFAAIPVVAIADEDDEEQRALAYAAGINGYITPPYTLDALVLHVEFFISGGSDIIEENETMDVARERFLQEVVKRLEGRIRELEAKNASLEKLDKMKDTFIQLTAHELRTPLTLIAGYSRLLEDHPPLQKMMADDENVGVLISGLAEGIGRMQGIIEEILTMSRIMTRQMELNIGPTNLGNVVKRALQGYHEAIKERQLRIRFDPAEWPVSMRADADLLRLVIANLLSNAIKYTPDQGEIFLTAQTSGQAVHFSVRDTGIGIDHEHQQYIFDRLHIAHDVEVHSTSKTAFLGGGLGLGLSICKGIVEAHKGQIWVESPGRDPETLPGSEFFVMLPLTTGSTQKPRSRLKRLTRT